MMDSFGEAQNNLTGMRYAGCVMLPKNAAKPRSSLLVAYGHEVTGTSIPSPFAVFRLMTKVNLLACSIGRSPGFSPARLFATYLAAL
jgi:hypothetical protein